MPIMKCTKNGKPGFKWGESGYCYTYKPDNKSSMTAAKEKALEQAAAIYASKEDTNSIINLQIADKIKKIRKFRKPPAILSPINIGREYKNDLLKIVHKIESEIRENIINQLSYIIKDAPFREDAWIDVLQYNTNRIRKFVSNIIGDVSSLSSDVAFKVNMWNKKQINKVIKRVIGVDIVIDETFIDDSIKSFVSDNVNLIDSLSVETINSIESIIVRGVRGGKNIERIKNEILSKTNLKQGKFKNVENRAALIARDQVNKLNADLNRMRQKEIGINQYIWRTALDERVRDSHRILEGRRMSWDNPNIYITSNNRRIPRPTNSVHLHPGQDINCRCYGEPYFENLKQ